MKRTILALFLILTLLTGCAGGSTANDSAMSNGTNAPESMTGGSINMGYDKGDYDYGYAEDSKAEMPMEPGSNAMTGSDVSNAAPSGNKLIYTADVTLETRDFDAANAELTDLVASVGGFFERRELQQGSNYRSTYCTIRVPASRFLEFLEQAGEFAHMTYRNEYSDDVSEAYYDLEARLATQRTKLNRLQELLAKAENMADIITIESAISDTELQIEYLTGSLRKYDSLIDFSTINLSLREVYRLSNEEPTPVTFGDRLGTAFKRGLEQGVENLEDFVIFVARNWLTMIVYAAVIVGAVILIRRRRSRRAASGIAKKSFFKKNEDTSNDAE